MLLIKFSEQQYTHLNIPHNLVIIMLTGGFLGGSFSTFTHFSGRYWAGTLSALSFTFNPCPENKSYMKIRNSQNKIHNLYDYGA